MHLLYNENKAIFNKKKNQNIQMDVTTSLGFATRVLHG